MHALVGADVGVCVWRRVYTPRGWRAWEWPAGPPLRASTMSSRQTPRSSSSSSRRSRSSRGVTRAHVSGDQSRSMSAVNGMTDPPAGDCERQRCLIITNPPVGAEGACRR